MSAWKELKEAIGARLIGPEFKGALQRSGMSVPMSFNSLAWLTGLPRPCALDGGVYNTEGFIRRSELVYACIECKAAAVCDPEIIIERRKNSSAEWERETEHPLINLLNKPNPYDDGDSYRRAWVASEAFSDSFYVEVTRNAAGLPVELYPLHPGRLRPVYENRANGSRYVSRYEYTVDGYVVKLKPDELMIRRRHGIQNIYSGVSAVQVALGSIEADLMQTNFVRSFFLNDGTPSGILKINGRKMTEAEAEALRMKWQRTYAAGGVNYRGVAILDQQADYQSIGSKMVDAGLTENTAINEARICSVFGVPPILVGAYVGLVYVNQRASVRDSQKDFWDNTLSPELKGWRNFLTWDLLPEFESIEDIRAGRVRVNWDMTQVKALDENTDSKHTRTRADYAAGMLTLDEARARIGLTAAEDEEIGGAFFKPPPPQVGIAEGVKSFAPHSNGNGNGNGNGHGGTLEKKSYDHEGITLGREPTATELAVLDFKAIAGQTAREKEQLAELLRELRELLIAQAADTASELSIDELYKLTLEPPEKISKEIQKIIRQAVERGRRSVIAEMNRQGAGIDPAEVVIDTEQTSLVLTGATVTRVTNEIQARAASQIATDAVLGKTAYEIAQGLDDALLEQSDAWIDSYAGGAVNSGMQAGRAEAMTVLEDVITTYQYSAVMDENTCEQCEVYDGETSRDIDDLPTCPNEDCDGRDRCRCIIIALLEEPAAEGEQEGE